MKWSAKTHYVELAALIHSKTSKVELFSVQALDSFNIFKSFAGDECKVLKKCTRQAQAASGCSSGLDSVAEKLDRLEEICEDKIAPACK
jgi:hypothetical protein